MEPRNRFHLIDSTNLCSLAGRYDNPIPTQILAPVDCLKIPALEFKMDKNVWESPQTIEKYRVEQAANGAQRITILKKPIPLCRP